MMDLGNLNCAGRLLVRLALPAVLLAGCAGHQLHREGLALVQQGQVEEGLTRLEQASRAAPDNLSYRTDLLRNRDQVVTRMLATADSERAAGRYASARALYERVLRLDASNSRASLGIETIQMSERHEAALERTETLLTQRDADGARALLKPVLLENPKNSRALQLQRKIEEQAARQALSEPTLKTKFNKPVTLQFRDANLKMVFEALSRTSGINVLLDREVKPDLKTSIFVKDVSVEDTINLILLQNQLEKKVISDNTVFIYPGTPAKVKEYQDLKIRSFHLTYADPKQMLTMIKTLLKTKDIFIHEKTNSIVMRDTPDAIRLAERMVADQDVAQPEVMLEVEVLEVTASRLTELGIKWPSSLSLATPPSVETLGQLRHLKANDLLVSPLSGTINLRLDDGDSNVLASPRIRVRNREKARVMIGSRVPVITNAVTPVSTGTPVVTGSVQYLDVGIKLEVEPDINQDDEVVIKVGLDVSSIIREVLNQQSGTLAYEIGTRNANTVLRLRDGETQILAGLISDDERRLASKVPGLGEIPVVGLLFGSHKSNGAKTEIVLSITPRMVGRARVPTLHEVEYWAGTENTVRSDPLHIKPQGSVSLTSTSAAASPATPAAPRPRAIPTRVPAANPASEGKPAAEGAPTAAPVSVSWQGPAQVKPGEKVSVTLNLNAQQAMSRLNLQVNFDPSVFNAIDVADGALMQQDSAFTLAKSIDQASGQIQLDLASQAQDAVPGTGGLATLVFEAIAPSSQSQIAVGRFAPSAAGGEAIAAPLPDPHLIKVAP